MPEVAFVREASMLPDCWLRPIVNVTLSASRPCAGSASWLSQPCELSGDCMAIFTSLFVYVPGPRKFSMTMLSCHSLPLESTRA